MPELHSRDSLDSLHFRVFFYFLLTQFVILGDWIGSGFLAKTQRRTRRRERVLSSIRIASGKGLSTWLLGLTTINPDKIGRIVRFVSGGNSVRACQGHPSFSWSHACPTVQGHINRVNRNYAIARLGGFSKSLKQNVCRIALNRINSSRGDLLP